MVNNREVLLLSFASMNALYNLASIWPIIMGLYVFGSMGFPPICIGPTMFMIHCGGKTLARAHLKIRVRKGARHSQAYMVFGSQSEREREREERREEEVNLFLFL